MGIFKKMMGYDTNEIDEAKKNVPSVKKMQFFDQTNLKSSKVVADYLIKGYPVLVNFEGVDLVEANQIVFFTSGVTYALKGEVFRIKGQIILFTDEDNLTDGTIRQFVNSSKGAN